MKKSNLTKGFIALFFIFILSSFSGNKPSYKMYNKKGKETKYSKLLKEAQKADVILFGELHNNSICHWLQLQLTKDMYAEIGDKLVLGAEMFERDNQLLIDEYLSGFISKKNFKSQSRLWPNYKTDYEPLIEFAKKNKIDFIATNVPRRYASVVAKKGFEGLDELSKHAKNFVAPLPIEYDPELKSYKSMLDMFKGMGGMSHVNANLPKAQALKDATMGYFINENLQKGEQFLHYHGTYHSNDFEGIYWYLKQYKKELNILTIATVEQSQLDSLTADNVGIADFVICVPDDMTKTH